MTRQTNIFTFLLFLLVGCGGGGNSSNQNNESVNITNEEAIEQLGLPTTQQESDAYVLERLGGLWEGSIKSYINATDTVQCEWAISLNLTSNKIPDSEPQDQYIHSSVFQGNATAELIFASGEDSDRCKTISYDLVWDAFCNTVVGVANGNEIIFIESPCNLNTNENESGTDSLSNRLFFDNLIDSSELTEDQSSMFIRRDRIDDPSINLTRSE